MVKQISGTIATIMVILGALFVWSFYRFLYTASGDLLMSFGVVNDYWQNGLIILIAGALLYFIGKKNPVGLFK